MRRVVTSVEVGHACSMDRITLEPSASMAALQRHGISVRPSDGLCILLDDTQHPHELLEFDALTLRAHAICPQGVHLLMAHESEFSHVARSMIARLSVVGAVHHERFRRDGSITMFMGVGVGGKGNGKEMGHPLCKVDASGVVRPLCAALSAAWSACRLGLEEWHGMAPHVGVAHHADTLLNVLPSALVGVEITAMNMLEAVHPHNSARVSVLAYN